MSSSSRSWFSFIDTTSLLASLSKLLLISGVVVYLGIILLPNIPSCPSPPEMMLSSSRLAMPATTPGDPNIPTPPAASPKPDDPPPPEAKTNLSHLIFGLVGSEKAWHHRKAYIETWWRPNVTRGFIYLDTEPTEELLPWSPWSPPYKVSDNITKIVKETGHVDATVARLVHGIMEVFRDCDGDDGRVRWVVMGDDDSIFMLENMVELLARHDHRKHYYFGGHSEFILSNFWYSFNQGFGGAGFFLSYPLAKALASSMEDCLKRYNQLRAADSTTMACIADLGTNLSPIPGIHQMDMRGDASGFLSSHPNSPLISLHHFDMVEPLFPLMDRFQSAAHLMAAASLDQTRILQQTICHHRPTNWTFSISWGYTAHIYERILPRSFLQNPIATFKEWAHANPRPPHWMFDVRAPVNHPCETPHVFFLESAKVTPNGEEIVSVYKRQWRRKLPACLFSGNHSADYIFRVRVYTPTIKRTQTDRCECCDVTRVTESSITEVKIRTCMENEVIA